MGREVVQLQQQPAAHRGIQHRQHLVHFTIWQSDRENEVAQRIRRQQRLRSLRVDVRLRSRTRWQSLRFQFAASPRRRHAQWTQYRTIAQIPKTTTPRQLPTDTGSEFWRGTGELYELDRNTQSAAKNLGSLAFESLLPNCSPRRKFGSLRFHSFIAIFL